MQLIALERLTDAQRHELDAGELHPFGDDDDGLDLDWREKDQYVVLRDGDRLVARAGLLVTHVEIGGATVPIVGLGDVLVSHDRRGQGLSLPVIDGALAAAAQLGPDLAMLFCSDDNTGLYARFGFAVIGDPVFARLSGRELRLPMPAMWRPLRPGAVWPPGAARLPGAPF